MFGERGMNNQQLQNFPVHEQNYNLEDVHRTEFYKNPGPLPGVFNKTFNGRPPLQNIDDFEIKTELEDKTNWNNQHVYVPNENMINNDIASTSSQMNQNMPQNVPLDIYNNSIFYQNNFQSVFPLDFYGRHHQAIANSFLSAYSNVNNSNLVVQQYLQQCNSHQAINNFNTLKESNSNNNPHYGVKKIDNPVNNVLPSYHQHVTAKPNITEDLLQSEHRSVAEELSKSAKMYESCDINKQKRVAHPYDSLKDALAQNSCEMLNGVFSDKSTHCDQFKNDTIDNSDELCSRDPNKNKKPTIKCWKCNFSFSNEEILKDHIKVCLLNVGGVTDQNIVEQSNSLKVENDSKGRYSCEVCSYVCQSPAILKIHERVHSGEKPFACTFCDYKSGQKNNVAKHILVHMKEKPYKCQYCDYRCAQKNNLIVHERTHTGVKPFACTFCEYKTVQKPNLVKHMYLHTNEKPFACDVCDYRCVQKTNLTKHKQKHTMEKPYVCNDCDYKSSQKSNLNKHMLTHIKEKPLKCERCPFRCVQQIELEKHRQQKHNLPKQEDTQESLDVIAKVNVYNTRSNSAPFNPVDIECVKIENASANF